MSQIRTFCLLEVTKTGRNIQTKTINRIFVWIILLNNSFAQIGHIKGFT